MVREVVQEVSSSYEAVREVGQRLGEEAKASPVVAPWLVAQVQGMQRSKRALLVYAHERALLLQRVRWELGGALPAALASAASASERAWFEAYSAALGVYMESAGGVELAVNVTAPPKELLVQVMVLRDAGKVALDDGSALELKQGKRVYLRRHEAEPLIRQGLLQHL